MLMAIKHLSFSLLTEKVSEFDSWVMFQEKFWLDALYEDKHFPGTEYIQAWGSRGDPNISDFHIHRMVPCSLIKGTKVTKK